MNFLKSSFNKSVTTSYLLQNTFKKQRNSSDMRLTTLKNDKQPIGRARNSSVKTIFTPHERQNKTVKTLPGSPKYHCALSIEHDLLQNTAKTLTKHASVIFFPTILFKVRQRCFL